CEIEPIGLHPNTLSVEEVVALIGPSTLVDDDAIATLAALAREHVVKTAAGEQARLAVVRGETIRHARSFFGQRMYDVRTEGGISIDEATLDAAENPPFIFYSDSGQRDEAAGRAAGEIVSTFLQPNWAVNEEATEAAREAAAAEVANNQQDYEVLFQEGEIIAAEGTRLSQLQIDAIRQLGDVFDPIQREGGLLAVLAILAGVLALYLHRFRPEFWARPRMVALLGILIVMAAGAVRGTVALAEASSWYVLPAVAFGLMTAVLFDSRIGALMALSMAILTAVGT